MTCNSPIFVDFETRSTVDLKAVGGRRYAESECSEVLCCAALVGDTMHVWSPWDVGGDYKRHLAQVTPPPVPKFARVARPEGYGALRFELHWGTEDPPLPVLEALEAGAPLAAHNAHGFDRIVWEQLDWPAAEWVDTVDLIRRASLPGSLEGACRAVYGARERNRDGSVRSWWGKDTAGAKILKTLYKPKKAKPATFSDPNLSTMPPLVRYCAQDVLLLACLWWDQGLGLPDVDDPVLAASHRVNDLGAPIDMDRVRRMVEAEQRLAATSVQRAAAALGITPAKAESLIGSPAQLVEFLGKQGLLVDDATGDTLQGLDPSAAHNPVAVEAVLDARLTVANVVRGKLAALVTRTDADGRYRGSLAYYGAQATGRWAGRGAQLQNFTRGGEAPEPEQATQIADLQRGLRNVVRAPAGRKLVTVDFSQVEARGLLWLAGDEENLRPYREGGDPYLRLAARTFGVPLEELEARLAAGGKDAVPERKIGKVQVLALGYGGGVGALGGYAAKEGIDLAAAGLTPERVVEAWRDAHPLVAGERTGGTFEVAARGSVPAYPVAVRRGGYWRALLKALKRALDTPPGDLVTVEPTGYVSFTRDPESPADMLCVLPSGRALVYRNVREELRPDKFSEVEGAEREGMVYDHPKGTRDLYPGILAENCLAADTRVLTQRGAVPISEVSEADLVWDGDSWIPHGGLIDQGEQEVGEWLGVRVTAEHRIFTGPESMCPAGAASDSTRAWALSLGRALTVLSSSFQATATTAALSACAIATGSPGSAPESFAEGAGGALPALTPPVGPLLPPDGGISRSLGHPNSSTFGATVTPESSPAATTPTTARGRTTGAAGSGCTSPGGPTGSRSSATRSPSTAGTTRAWTSTESTTTGVTSPATSDSCLGGPTPPTGGRPSGSSLTGSGSRSASSATDSARSGGASTRSGITSTKAATPRRSWTPTGRVERVYDLLNCGPRSRFTILTDEGPVLVHNCTQAVCRDLLAAALVRLDAEGYAIPLHVHDELVLEVPAAQADATLEHVIRVMSEPPPWAPGFPLAAEGAADERWSK